MKTESQKQNSEIQWITFACVLIFLGIPCGIYFALQYLDQHPKAEATAQSVAEHGWLSASSRIYQRTELYTHDHKLVGTVVQVEDGQLLMADPEAHLFYLSRAAAREMLVYQK